ncbi:MAG: DUF996 domain-containing protein [Nitrososphaerota archaeon]|jgi:uncharacterized membrane protein|nr:DUF996 domain-containing protein [Nitrososphaerota archaeon]
MTVESSKTLAGIGSLLLLIPFLNIAGLVLVFLGMRDLSEHYKDPNIIRNVVMGGIFGVISTILSIFAIIFDMTITGLIIGIPLSIIAFVFALLMASRLKKALYALADRSGERLFRTAGTWLWFGAILTIVVIGAFLIWIAYIILATAFFSLKIAPNTSQYRYAPPPPASTASTTTKSYCPYCGASVQPETSFCAHCGKQI